MKLIEMKCKNCGSMLEVEEGKEYVTCKYCHTSFAIDDEQNNMYESGYDFEKGRIQAQNDEVNEVLKHQRHSMKIFSFIFSIFFIIIAVFIVKHVMEMPSNTMNMPSNTMDISIRSFNSQFDSGTLEKMFIEDVLDYVVSNNKTNSNQLVTVVYQEMSTTDSDEIINIKHLLKDLKKYEVILDYDEDGYVNKITIMDI